MLLFILGGMYVSQNQNMVGMYQMPQQQPMMAPTNQVPMQQVHIYFLLFVQRSRYREILPDGDGGSVGVNYFLQILFLTPCINVPNE